MHPPAAVNVPQKGRTSHSQSEHVSGSQADISHATCTLPPSLPRCPVAHRPAGRSPAPPRAPDSTTDPGPTPASTGPINACLHRAPESYSPPSRRSSESANFALKPLPHVSDTSPLPSPPSKVILSPTEAAQRGGAAISQRKSCEGFVALAFRLLYIVYTVFSRYVVVSCVSAHARSSFNLLAPLLPEGCVS